MNIGQQVLAVAEAGVELASTHQQTRDVYALLSVLLGIEDALDKGRILLERENREQYLPSINEKMDSLRKEIRVILETLPADKVEKFMADRGESLKRQFSL